MWRGLISGWLVAFVCLCGNLEAQPGRRGPGPAPPLAGQSLGLSPAQEQALREIDGEYLGRLQDLRSRLLAQRLEFKAALANPQAEEQAIRSKAAELRRLWLQCQETTTEYYLKIRAVLTPGQRRAWFSGRQPSFLHPHEGEP